MSLHLRPTTAADLPRLTEWESALHTAVFLGEIGAAWHERALADPRQGHLVAERDGEPFAFAVLAGLGRAPDQADQVDRGDPADRAGRVDPVDRAGRGDPMDRVDRVLEIRRLVVAPERRGAGVGRALLRAVRDRAYLDHRADRVWLDVRSGNARARRLYESEGFMVTSRDVGEDLLIMFHRGCG
ncbi:GNAT family N-acetyltransferase [Streptomyces radicis]|uniref:GNAT family N-acetyltransferase n=1 Tax=Streptomyces radicis TaxID=1750517 RepID=A0A3A9X0K7_9ACTN|nr:GNAT family N-acetyltransferase [Streptomyces radicis]RKN11977.1 GNAT family N-acetyltransferase [Streptomyces radicis]RKN25971.1 GNAT family N-acetyltransferase [Streptomyces radicis]